MRLVRHILENYWVATVSFIAFSTLIALSLSISGLHASNAAIALALGSVATGLTLWKTNLRSLSPTSNDFWLWKSAAAIAFVLFALRAFLWLIFLKGDQIAVLSRNNLGDLPLHIQYIRFFSHGAPLWPVNPIHAHSSIGYPFGIDYFNALLDVLGVPLFNALIVTGLAGALATGIALYRWGRAFGVAGFLFNGSVAGFAIFTTGKWLDYQQDLDWKSLPLALFVTQRGFLYALPAGLLLLTHWRQTQSAESNETPLKNPLPLWLECLIYSTMPLFHIHTFLFLSAMLASLAVFGKNRRRFWWLIAAAFLPATLLMLKLTDNFHAAGGLAWHPGWMQGAHFSATYWLENFGALPFLIAGLIVMLVRRPDRAAWLFVGPALGMLVATLFVQFSPWEWDNTKLMMWSLIVLLPYLWTSLLVRTPMLVRVPVCLLFFGSGFISLCGGLASTEKGYDIADQSVVLSVAQAVEDIPILETFASAPGYAHPLVFAGRRLALGYHGHMVGHGIPYEAEKRAMDRLMTGADDWQDAAKFLGVHYIFWGLEEEKTWPASEKPWVLTSELIATEDWGEIYKLP
ncbi:MAG: hypothetical protein ABIT76_06045 [Chthoniobacterales bacterium]